MEVLLFIVLAVAVVTVGGYVWNREGPGDVVRDPRVPNRRHNWVP